MTIESCLIKPKNERFRYFSQSHIEFCEGNKCAAGLMDFFAQCHVRKLEKEQIINGKVYQYHSLEELRLYLLELFGETAISNAVKYLETRGVITRHDNPHDKWKRKGCYIFYPEIYNAWITKRILENEDTGLPEELLIPQAESVKQASRKKQGSIIKHRSIKDFEAANLSGSSSPEVTKTQSLESLNLLTSCTATEINNGSINHEANYEAVDLRNASRKNEGIDSVNLRHGCRNFTGSLYNKINNKKKQEPTTTPRDFTKIGDENKPAVGCVVFNNQKNIFSKTDSEPTLPPIDEKMPLSTPNGFENRIGNCLTREQSEYIQTQLADWSMRGKISNPKQIFAEIEFALLDKETLNRCHHSFTKKLSVISELIENNRWTTPVALQSQNKQANAIKAKDTKVVYLQRPQTPTLCDIEASIKILEAEIMGSRNQLEIFKDTPTFATTKNFIEQKIKEFEAEREVLLGKWLELKADN